MRDTSAPGTVLGVDIGGSAIKSAPVDIVSGRLLRPRQHVLTPDPSTPKAVGEVVGELVRQLDWHGEVGCAFPAIVKHGVTLSAANVDASWIESDADAEVVPAAMGNDAGIAGAAWFAGHGAAAP